VADAKEESAFAAHHKEARKCRGYESFRLLAGVATFDSCIGEGGEEGRSGEEWEKEGRGGVCACRGYESSRLLAGVVVDVRASQNLHNAPETLTRRAADPPSQ
jgi:hypothetical protein